MTKNGSVIGYKYDDSGIRISKTVNNVTTAYTTIDGRITSQSDGTNSLYFRYDRNNELFGVNINGTEYIYLKNMQGDIEGILDMAGSLVVSYAYDAWGKVLSVTGTLADTIGQLNPMRYRGYYLDSETGYYYLQSRYYNPDWCRFINADKPTILSMVSRIVSANLFSYCTNNPIINTDSNGYWAQNYYGFKLTSDGFNVYMNSKFLSRAFCISYATDVIKRYGSWYWWGKGYKKMDLTRIAAELFAHAIGYYVGKGLNHVNRSWGTGLINSGRYIQVNRSDHRTWQFYAIWYGVSAIKWNRYVRAIVPYWLCVIL